MKRYRTSLKLLAALFFAALFFTEANAQGRRNPYRGNGPYRNGYRNVYNYNSNYYRYNRPYVRPGLSVGIGFGAPYRYVRPVYRPAYYPYTHFGPSFGFRINVLPFGYNSMFIGGNPYYYNDGVYYRPYSQGGYEVTQAPLGAQVKHLPSNAKVTVIDGQKYYQLGGTFYQEEITDKNKLRYRVVGTDGVLNTSAGQQMDEVNAIAPDNSTAATAPTAPAVQQPATAAPEPGSRLNQLPANSKAVVISQQKYYVTPDGVYYKEVINGDAIQYEAIGGDANSGQ